MSMPQFFGSSEAHLNLVPALTMIGAISIVGLEVWNSVVLKIPFRPDRFMGGYAELIAAAGLGAGGQRFLATLNNRVPAPPPPGGS